MLPTAVGTDAFAASDSGGRGEGPPTSSSPEESAPKRARTTGGASCGGGGKGDDDGDPSDEDMESEETATMTATPNRSKDEGGAAESGEVGRHEGGDDGGGEGQPSGRPPSLGGGGGAAPGEGGPSAPDPELANVPSLRARVWERRYNAEVALYESEKARWKGRISELNNAFEEERTRYDALSAAFDGERRRWKACLEEERRYSAKLEARLDERRRGKGRGRGGRGKAGGAIGGNGGASTDDDDGGEQETRKEPESGVTDARRWKERIDELQCFRENYESFGVPPPHGEGLDRWLKRQREWYATRLKSEVGAKAGAATAVVAAAEAEDENEEGAAASRDKSKADDSVDVKIAERADPTPTGDDSVTEVYGAVISRQKQRWMNRLEELRKYKEEQGHLDVPRKDALGYWLHKQREGYNKWRRGESPGALTDERREALTSLGVLDLWENRRGNQQARWDRQLEMLREYRDEYMHVNVPRSRGALGNWLKKQKDEYKKWERGEKSSLTVARRVALEQLGVQWKPVPR